MRLSGPDRPVAGIGLREGQRPLVLVCLGLKRLDGSAVGQGRGARPRPTARAGREETLKGCCGSEAIRSPHRLAPARALPERRAPTRARRAFARFVRLKEWPIDPDDVGPIDRPEIPTIEAVGHMIGEHEILAVTKGPTATPDGQGTAGSIMAQRRPSPLAIDQQTAGNAVADVIARTGDDRLHE